MRTHRILLLICVLSAATGPAAAELATLIENLENVRADSGVPAFAFALVDATQVHYAAAHGLADLDSAAPVDAATRFRIGSITKTFTALAVLLAAERGLLALDNHFDHLAGANLVDNPWADSAPLRLVHLLEHTAGLNDLTYEEMHRSDPAPQSLAAALHEFRANRRVRWRPGQHYSYSNAGAGLAAYALERVDGRSYEQFVAEELFGPLELDSASVLLDAATAAHLARGYDSDRVTPIPYWHMLFRPFGAINATIGDMAKFVRFMLNDGRAGERQVIAARSVKRMERVETTLGARHGLTFGYGAGLYSWYHGGYRFFGHGGDGDGYLAHFGYNRDSGLGYFVVINAFTHRPLARMRTLIEDYMVDSLPPPTLAPPAALPAHTAAFLGPYRAATRRFGSAPDSARVALRLIQRDATVYSIDGDGHERALVPLGRGLWRRPQEPAATIAIVRNDRGRWVFQGERAAYIQIAAPGP